MVNCALTSLLNSFSHKFSNHLMQKHTHTTFLLLLKKKNEHEVLVICTRSKNMFFKDLKKKLSETQGSLRLLWEVFSLSGKFLDSKSGNPDRVFCLNNNKFGLPDTG